MYEQYKKQAEKLLVTLQNKCTAKTIKENYGQREARNFMDKVRKLNLTYMEECQINDILKAVLHIQPK